MVEIRNFEHWGKERGIWRKVEANLLSERRAARLTVRGLPHDRWKSQLRGEVLFEAIGGVLGAGRICEDG